MSRLGRSEILRQTVHIGSGLMALLIVWWGIAGTIALAGGAIVFNVWLLPRLAPALLRSTESDRRDVGIVSYPLAVLWMALLFGRRPEVVAAAWGVLAFGDGAATLAGRAFGSRALPWNPEKSWMGSLCYWLFGTVAAGLLLFWASPIERHVSFVWVVCGVVVLVSALLESLPLRLDDNLGVPLLTALALLLLLETEGAWTAVLASTRGSLLPAVALNAALGAVAFLLGGVNRAGLLSGMVVGTVIYLTLGLPGYAVLVAFYGLGTAATRVGIGGKLRSGIAEGRGGRRSARNVVANTGVATISAVLAVTSAEGGLFVAAFAAALAAATGDTLASEIGQAVAGRTRLLTTLRVVEPGTEGGISLVGTLAGVVGAAGVAQLGGWLGLYGPSRAMVIASAAVAAIFVDSLLGATLERAGRLDNEAVNFSATLSAALAVFWILRLAGY